MALIFDIGFKADGKGLDGITSQIETIGREIRQAFELPKGSNSLSTELSDAVVQARILESALKKATSDKGISFFNLNQELKKAGTSAEQMVATLAKGGPAFSGSLNAMLKTFATADRSLINISGKIREMGRVMTQSFKFSAAQNTIQWITGQAQEAIHWVKELDDALTQIQIVSGKSATDMAKVYDVVIAKSKQLRTTAQDYAEASQIFYQQGLSDEDVARRSEITIKAAKAAGQSTEAMSQQLTAIWNTYQMQGSEMERAASVAAKMGAETAVQFKDIAEAMSISASAASTMGVSYDSLAAIIATVGTATQQSASIIGNAYKTIFSRFQQLKVDGTDGTITLKAVSQQLQALGVNVLDQAGNLRELDDVIMEVGTGWDDYTDKQKQAIAQLVGGTRQYTQFLALMNNFDKYQENLSKNQGETGSATLERQFKTSIDNIDTAMKMAQETWSRGFSQIFTSDSQKDFYRGVEKIGSMFEEIVNTVGGLSGILQIVGIYLIGKIAPAVGQIKQGFIDAISSFSIQSQVDRAINDIQRMKAATADMLGGKRDDAGNVNFDNSGAEAQYRLVEEKLNLTKMTTDATIRLTDIEKNGTAEQRAKAEILKEQISYLQDQAMTEMDALKTINLQAEALERAAKAREAAVKASMASGQSSDPKRQESSRIGASAAGASAGAGIVKAATKQNLSLEDGKIKASKKALQELSEVTDKFKEKLEQTEKKSKTMSGALNTIKTASDELKAAVAEGKMTQEQYIASLEKLQVGLQAAANGEEIQENLKRAEAQSEEEAANAIRVRVAALQQAENADQNLIATLQQQQATHEEAAVKALNEANVHRDSAVAYQQQAAAMGEAIVHTQQLSDATTQLTAAQQRAKDLHASVKTAISGLGQAAMQVGQSLMSLNMCWNMLNTAMQDGEVSFSELLPILMMAIPAILNMGKALMGVGANFVDAGVKAVIAAGGTKAEAKAMGTGTLFAKGFSAALKEVAASMMLVNWWVVLIVAAIAALIAILVIMNKNAKERSLEEQFKDAQKAADDMKQTLEDTRAEAENLKKTIDAYGAVKKKLSECEKGTQEWKDALQETNAAAVELLTSLKGVNIKDAYTRGENGEIQVKQEYIDKAQKDSNVKVAQAEYNANMAQSRADSLGLQVQGQNLMKGLGANFTQMIGDQMTTVSVSAKDLFEGLRGNADLLGDDLGKANKAVQDYVSEQLKARGYTDAAAQAVAKEYFSTQEQLLAFQNGLNEVNIGLENVSESMMLYASQMADAKLGDDYDQVAKDVASERLAKETASLTEKYLGQLTSGRRGDSSQKYFDADGGSKFDVQRTDGAEQENRILDWYNEATKANYGKMDNFTQGNDVNREFHFRDAEGKEVVKTAEQVAQEVAAAKALENLTKNAEEAQAALAKIGEGVAGDAFNKLLAGNSQDLTKEDVKNLQDDFKASKNADGSQMTVDQYMESKGFTPEMMEKYRGPLQDALKINWNQVVDGLPDSLKKIEGLTQGSAEKLKETFKTMTNSAEQEFTDTFDAITENLTANQKAAVANAMADIDWSDYDAMDSLKGVLEDQGIYVDLTADQWEVLANKMRDAGNAVPDLQAATDRVIQAYNVLGEAQVGDVVKAEDVEKLKEMGVDIEGLFMKTADGQYKVVKATDEVVEKLREEQKAALEANNKLAAGKEAFAKTNWGWDQEDGSRKEVDWSRAAAEGNKYFDTAGWAENAMKSENTKAAIEALGYNPDELLEAIKAGKEEGEALAKKLFAELAEMQNTDYEALTQEAYDMLASTAKTPEQLQEMFNAGEINEQAYLNAMQLLSTEMMNQAQSLEELQNIYNSMGGRLEVYDANLQRLAESYDNCTEELERFQLAMASGDETRKKAARENLEYAISVGEMAKKHGLDAKELESYAKRLQENVKVVDKNGKAQKLNKKEALDLAVANKRLDKGITDIRKNWDKYTKDLKTLDKESAEYSETVNALKTSLGDMLNMDGSLLSDAFVTSEEAAGLMEKAINGDSDALLKLKLLAGDDIIAHLDVDKTALEEVTGLWNSVKADVEAARIKGRAEINSEEFLAKLNQMAETGQMTKDQIEATLASLHVSANVRTDYVEQTQKMPVTVTKEWSVQEGTMPYSYAVQTEGSDEPEIKTKQIPAYKRYSQTWEEEPVEVKGYFPKYTIEGTEGKGSTSVGILPAPIPSASATNTPMNSGSGSGGGGGGGGGGGNSAPKTVSKPKKKNVIKDEEKDDIRERYENLTTAMDHMSKALERISKAQDGAWGTAKVAQMTRYYLQLQKMGAVQTKLIQETKDYLVKDKDKLLKDLQRFGVSVEAIFEGGTLMNPEDIRNAIQAQMDAAYAQFNAIAADYDLQYDAAYVAQMTQEAWDALGLDEQLDDAKTTLDDRLQELQYVVDSLDQYKETESLLEDRINEQIDRIHEWIGKKMEIIQHKMDFKLEMNNHDLELIAKLTDRLIEAGIGLEASIKNLTASQNMHLRNLDVQMQYANEAQQKLNNIRNGDADGKDESWFRKAFGDDAWDEFLKTGEMPEVVSSFLKDIRYSMEEEVEAIHDDAQKAWEVIVDGMEKFFDRFEKVAQTIDQAMGKLDVLDAFQGYVGTGLLSKEGRDNMVASAKARTAASAMRAQNAVVKRDAAKTEISALREMLGIDENGQKNGTGINEEVDDLQKAYDAKLATVGGDPEQAFEEYTKLNKALQAKANAESELATAEERLATAEEEITSNTAEMFNNAIQELETIKQTLAAESAQAMEGLFTSWEEAMSMFEMAKEDKSLWFDDYDKNYHTNTLQYTLDAGIKDMDIDISKYEGLAKVQQQINHYKEEGVKMSDEERRLLEAELNLELERAKLAEMEDARENAKNTMRLTRDASGNYGYVYSGDEESQDKIEEQKKKLEDMEYQYKKLREDMEDGFAQSLIAIGQEYTEFWQNVNQQAYDSDEQYRAMVDQQSQFIINKANAVLEKATGVTQQFGTQIGTWEFQFKESAGGIVLQEESLEGAFDKLSQTLWGGGTDGSNPGGVYGAWLTAQATTAGELNNYNDKIGNGLDTLIDVKVHDAIKRLIGADGTYNVGDLASMKTAWTNVKTHFADEGVLIGDAVDKTQKTISAKIGKSTDQPGTETVWGTLNSAKKAIDELATEVANACGEDGMQSSFGKLLDYMTKTWYTEYSGTIDKAIGKIKEFIEANAALEQKNAKEIDDAEKKTVQQETKPQPTLPLAETTPTPVPQQTLPPAQPSPPDNTALAEGVAAAIWIYGGSKSGWGNNPGRAAKFQEKGVTAAQGIINSQGPSGGLYNKWWPRRSELSQYYYGAFDTGGYTGDWDGEEGRLAILHSKELVLNKEDTENILEAVRAMRAMTDAQAEFAMQRELMEAQASIAAAMVPAQQTYSEPIEQNVRIEAHFDRVTMAHEIEEAFNDLINQAAQYTRRR